MRTSHCLACLRTMIAPPVLLVNGGERQPPAGGLDKTFPISYYNFHHNEYIARGGKDGSDDSGTFPVRL